MQSNGSGMVAGLQQSLHSYKSNYLSLKGLNPNSKNARVSFSLEKKKYSRFEVGRCCLIEEKVRAARTGEKQREENNIR